MLFHTLDRQKMSKWTRTYRNYGRRKQLLISVGVKRYKDILLKFRSRIILISIDLVYGKSKTYFPGWWR